MSFSLCLFTATWLTGQTPTPPETTITTVPATTTIQVITPDSQSYTPEMFRQIAAENQPAPPPPPPGLLGRIRSFFSGRRDSAVTTAGYQSYQAGGSGQRPTVAPLQPGLELSGKEVEKVGHDKDHTWITGKLMRVDGNRWVVRYGIPYEVDPYQGCVQLTAHADLAKLQPGDLVCVHGRVVSGRPGPHAGAIYEVREINLVEHAKR